MGVRAGIITLLHTACGAGILAVPYAFVPFGLIPGILTLLFCGCCSLFGLLLQSLVSTYTPPGKRPSFFILATQVHPKLAVIFDIAISVKCFGVGTSYLIAAGDLLPDLLNLHFHNARFFCITIVTLFIAAPLSFLRKLTALRYTSTLALVSVFYLAILIQFHYLKPSSEIDELKGDVSTWFPHDPENNLPSPLRTLPIFIFAYTCHHNMFTVISEQKNVSFNTLRLLSIIALTLACSLYIIVGMGGYATFGSNTLGNVVAQYPGKHLATWIGQASMAAVVSLAFPLQCHPARASLINIINFFVKSKPEQLDDDTQFTQIPDEESMFAGSNENEEIILQQQEQDISKFQHITTTTILLICSWLVAISVHSLAHVLAIVGATGSTAISFILPGLFGAILINRDTEFQGKKMFWVNVGRALVIWGCCVMCVSLYAALFMN